MMGSVRTKTCPHRTHHSNDFDRKSTRLNSSHITISYAVFCLKKKKLRTEPAQHVDRHIHRVPDVLPHSNHSLPLVKHHAQHKPAQIQYECIPSPGNMYQDDTG